MARFRRKARSMYRAAKRGIRRSSKSGVSPMKIVLMSGLYGAGRNTLHSFIPDTPIPYSDSVISGVVGWYLAKKGNGYMKAAGMSILAVEAAAIGQAATSGMFGASQAGSGSTSSSW